LNHARGQFVIFAPWAKFYPRRSEVGPEGRGEFCPIGEDPLPPPPNLLVKEKSVFEDLQKNEGLPGVDVVKTNVTIQFLQLAIF
jgi:hypothetical protein